MIERRWVFDTNVLISRLLNPGGTAARAVDMGMDSGVVLLSDATFSELAQVLMRPKFDAYLTRDERAAALDATAAVCRRVLISRPLRACRDPRNDKFLDVAVHGSADALVTGDADLLALHPFHRVPILTPNHFLEAWLPRISSGVAPERGLQRVTSTLPISGNVSRFNGC